MKCMSIICSILELKVSPFPAYSTYAVVIDLFIVKPAGISRL